MKNNELRREEGITGMLEFTLTKIYLMEVYASIQPFGFAIAVLVSTRIPNNVKKLVVTDLQ